MCNCSFYHCPIETQGKTSKYICLSQTKLKKMSGHVILVFLI